MWIDMDALFRMQSEERCLLLRRMGGYLYQIANAKGVLLCDYF